jgi:Flp pilus assembly pilin Flp
LFVNRGYSQNVLKLAFGRTPAFEIHLRGTSMSNIVKALWQDEQGQDLIEYTLLMAFVALASAALFISSGASISSIWSDTNSQLSSAATTAAS